MAAVDGYVHNLFSSRNILLLAKRDLIMYIIYIFLIYIFIYTYMHLSR